MEKRHHARTSICLPAVAHGYDRAFPKPDTLTLIVDLSNPEEAPDVTSHETVLSITSVTDSCAFLRIHAPTDV